MVRKLARRLVDVDLLDQAAELLKYQADNRLDGVARAQVDTDLALIQVMNRQPEAALDALNASRTTLLPGGLQSQRRVIEARGAERTEPPLTTRWRSWTSTSPRTPSPPGRRFFGRSATGPRPASCWKWRSATASSRPHP